MFVFWENIHNYYLSFFWFALRMNINEKGALKQTERIFTHTNMYICSYTHINIEGHKEVVMKGKMFFI